MSQARQAARNSLYSIVAFAWPLALAFFTTPYIVRHLGHVQYGLLALVTSFVSFFGALDFGVSPSLVKFIATLEAKREFHPLNRIFSSALFFYFGIGLLGAIGITLMPRLITSLSSKLDPSTLHIAYIVFLLAGISFAINMILSAFSSIPGALQRFDQTSKINLAVATTGSLGAVILVYTHHNIISITFLGLLTALAALAVYYRLDHHLIPSLHITAHVNSESFKSIFSFSVYAFIAGISGVIIAELDRLILGGMLGPAAVTYYVVPGNITIKILGFVVAAATIVFPLTASLLASNELDKLLTMYKRATRLIDTALVIGVVPMLVLAREFLGLWIGQDFAANSTIVFQVLLLTYLISSLHVVPFLSAYGAGRPKYNAAYAFAVAMFNVALMFILIPRFNINGAAYAYLLAVIPTTLLFVAIVEKQLLRLRTKEFYLDLIWRLALIALALALMAVAVVPVVHNLGIFAVLYIVIMLIGAGGAYLIKLIEPEDVALVYKLVLRKESA